MYWRTKKSLYRESEFEFKVGDGGNEGGAQLRCSKSRGLRRSGNR